jgi:hypothetical protein
LTENHGVGGSIPPMGTRIFKGLATLSTIPKLACPHCVRDCDAGTKSFRVRCLKRAAGEIVGRRHRTISIALWTSVMPIGNHSPPLCVPGRLNPSKTKCAPAVQQLGRKFYGIRNPAGPSLARETPRAIAGAIPWLLVSLHRALVRRLPVQSHALRGGEEIAPAFSTSPPSRRARASSSARGSMWLQPGTDSFRQSSY